jgi:hypothetical protein
MKNLAQRPNLLQPTMTGRGLLLSISLDSARLVLYPIREGNMEADKPILEQMTDMMADAAHATKKATKSAVRKVKKVAKKMMPKKSPKKSAVKKKPAKKKRAKKSRR